MFCKDAKFNDFEHDVKIKTLKIFLKLFLTLKF